MSKSAALVKELSVLGVVGSAGSSEVEFGGSNEHLEADESMDRISALCESISDGFTGFSAAAQELHQQALHLEEMFNVFLSEMEALDEELMSEGNDTEDEEEDEEEEEEDEEEDEDKKKENGKKED